jgi:hypothetical protein
MRELFIEERKRSIVLERDVFKQMSEKRKIEAQFKALQEANIKNAQNRNNTSSAFSLPSEFKQAWDELVTDLIIDAFSNIEEYKEVVPCVSELFIALREEILEMKTRLTHEVAHKMNLISNE